VDLVRVERAGAVATLTMARPSQRNAVSARMLEELGEGLASLREDRVSRVVVLAGEGPDFCAGADVGELAGARASLSGAGYGRMFEKVLAEIADHPLPVIARVQGAALGAGCQLAVACDLAVASVDAKFGIPSARLGIVINIENIERLVIAVGLKRAGEMLFAGRILSGTEAATSGLVNRAVPAEELASSTAELATSVAEAAPLSVRGSKLGIRAALSNVGLAEFDSLAAGAFASDDLREGLAAFMERRKPEFGGA
jgi:enoyl-CoA hydratase/carnithine racemase